MAQILYVDYDVDISYYDDNMINKIDEITIRIDRYIFSRMFSSRDIDLLYRFIKKYKCKTTVCKNDKLITKIYIKKIDENQQYNFENFDVKYNNGDDYHDLFDNLIESAYLNLRKNINMTNLINLIELFNCDFIINVSARDMLHYRDKKTIYNRGITDTIIKDDYLRLETDPETIINKYILYDLLGCYIHTKNYYNFGKISYYLNKINCTDDKKVIVLCLENIEIMKHDLLRSKKKIDKMLNKFLFQMVYIHEFGHLVFDFNCLGPSIITSEKFNEQQANFYLSNNFNGIYDKLIKRLTDIQSSNYKNPLLYSKDCVNFLDYTKTKAYKLYMHKEK